MNANRWDEAEGNMGRKLQVGAGEPFEKRILRRIFGLKREEDGSWRKLHNDELHSLYSSPNIVMVIKSRRMIWAGHVARMGERCLQGFGWESRREETTGKT
jgi:hypothetical protein